MITTQHTVSLNVSQKPIESTYLTEAVPIIFSFFSSFLFLFLTEAMLIMWFYSVCECVWLGLAGCVLGLMFQIMHTL